MSPILRKTLKGTAYAIGAVVGAAALYYGVAQVLSRIPVAAVPTTEPATVPFFVRSNGVHTDLVVPVKSSFIDWSQQLPFSNTQANDTTYHFVGIGWGDKGFYLETPTWAELKPRTAIRAGFWLSTTLIHATYYREADLVASPQCVPLRLTPTQYRATAPPTTMPFTRPIAATACSIPATPGPTEA
jgi:hypothetical protein